MKAESFTKTALLRNVSSIARARDRGEMSLPIQRVYLVRQRLGGEVVERHAHAVGSWRLSLF